MQARTTRLPAYSPVLTSCSNLRISRNLAKAKQLNNLEQLSGAALFVYKDVLLMTKDDKLILELTNEHKKLSDLLANFEEKYILAEFDWGEPVEHEYQVDGEKDCALT